MEPLAQAANSVFTNIIIPKQKIMKDLTGKFPVISYKRKIISSYSTVFI